MSKAPKHFGNTSPERLHEALKAVQRGLHAMKMIRGGCSDRRELLESLSIHYGNPEAIRTYQSLVSREIIIEHNSVFFDAQDEELMKAMGMALDFQIKLEEDLEHHDKTLA